MKPFRFALQRILEFRATRVEEEERKLALLQEQLGSLDREIRRLDESRQEASRSMATAEQSSGEDLRALMRFCARLEREKTAVGEKKSVCEKRLDQQRRSCVEARREHRLLETLRERQYAEWKREADRETDRVAGELYLARWQPGKSSGGSRPNEK